MEQWFSLSFSLEGHLYSKCLSQKTLKWLGLCLWGEPKYDTHWVASKNGHSNSHSTATERGVGIQEAGSEESSEKRVSQEGKPYKDCQTPHWRIVFSCRHSQNACMSSSIASWLGSFSVMNYTLLISDLVYNRMEMYLECYEQHLFFLMFGSLFNF